MTVSSEPGKPRSSETSQEHVRPSEIFLAADRLPLLLYIVLVAPFVLLMALLNPPNQAQDEWAHFLRAAQLAGGELIGPMTEGVLGGTVPRWGREVQDGFVADHAASLETRQRFGSEKPDETRVFAAFPFVIYPPTSYIGGALGLAMGKMINATGMERYLLGRLGSALFAIVLSASALFFARRGQMVMLVVLSLPMTVFLEGSYNQDGATIALAALAAALFSRTDISRRPRAILAYASLLLGLVVAARLPSFPLLLLPIGYAFKGAVSVRDGLVRLAWVLPGIALAIAWIILQQIIVELTAPTFVVADYAQPAAQIARIVHDPLWFLSIVLRSTAGSFTTIMHMFFGIGVIELHEFFYEILSFSVLTSLLFDFTALRKFDLPLTMFALFLLFAVIGATASAELLLWTPLESPYIFGIQGRYFLAPVAAVTGALGAASPWRHRQGALVIVAACVWLANLGGVFALLSHTYYGGALA